jgi:hypothetical protein
MFAHPLLALNRDLFGQVVMRAPAIETAPEESEQIVYVTVIDLRRDEVLPNHRSADVPSVYAMAHQPGHNPVGKRLDEECRLDDSGVAEHKSSESESLLKPLPRQGYGNSHTCPTRSLN